MTYQNTKTPGDGFQPIPTHVDAPGGGYTFYSEENADLTTLEGRLAWFCAHFQVKPFTIEYDPDEPGAVLMSDGLLEFCKREGVSIDWLCCGHVSCLLADHRKHNRVTPTMDRILNAVGKMDELETTVFTAALTAIVREGVDMDDAMQAAGAEIRAMRESAKANEPD